MRAVNYYERHLGDYARDTAHLSLLEHGVYTLLLDRYYATERSIPADQVHRFARAKTDEERSAVDAVLAEFFTLTDGYWFNPRAEIEIADARQRIQAARQNGRKGGRPRATPENNQQETQWVSAGLANQNPTVTQAKALQTPGTSLQSKRQDKPARSARGSRIPEDFQPDLDYAKQQIADIDSEAEAQKFRDYWSARAGAAGIKLDWPATWRNWIRNCLETGRYAKRTAGKLPPGVVMR